VHIGDVFKGYNAGDSHSLALATLAARQR
jgi:hypothetical protein